MKNTIKIQQIGSHSIIDRFDTLPIDTAMTELRNRKAISELPEQIAVNQKVADKNRHTKKARSAAGKLRIAQRYINDAPAVLALAEGDEKATSYINIGIERAKAVVTNESKNFESFNAASKGCDHDINELGRICDHKRREHIKANPIYSHPRKNEVVIDDAKFDELKAVFNKQNEKIKVILETYEDVVITAIGDQQEVKAPFQRLISHEIIADFRGCQYFYLDLDEKWIESETITDLGVTMETVVANDFHDSAIERKDLSPEQSEEIRIQGLTAEQKEVEKAGAIEIALNQAAAMKTKLEIQGSTAAKALTDSKAWYADQETAIGAKYA
ncbi:MAG: hypothetical protein GWP06_00375 [Actinobacteria bacterium]|nr:hypothetical protein [Actinomycetota bacterium]